ncbi:MAG: sigma-70 family RNA polymerase sigma factor [Clostridia bacterium]|nr:sigma-70 family RNA polymerase sigma factor [Clostridia bacterium]
MSHISEDTIDTLYRMYEQSMYFEAYKILHDEYLAEDALHEAFLRLIRNRQKIMDPESPAVRSYAYKAVRSAALDLYRRQKKQRENCLVLDETIENTVVVEEMTMNLPPSLLAELPSKYASVMRCLFWDGLSVRETSAVLKISEDLVRKRCERARKLLKETPIYTEKETYYER